MLKEIPCEEGAGLEVGTKRMFAERHTLDMELENILAVALGERRLRLRHARRPAHLLLDGL